ncbi:MAG TPA: sugar kinase [Rubrobacteraceae bacterium]|nr:sugar kinase [Rubrobacteraceae bacterium]
MRVPRVVVVGDLIYDLLVRIDGSVAFGTDTFAPIHAVAGGSGANAAAWLASLGIKTDFVGRVGDDVLGEALAAALRGAGVTPHLARDPSLGTGKVFVLVDGAGERTMITDRGAGDALRPEDLPPALFDGGHLHLSGYTFSGGSRRETALEALRLAHEAGMSVSVDPSSVPLLEAVGPERFLEWTRGVDLCFPNLEEGSLLGGERDPDRVAQRMLDHYPGVVLKLGAAGALYAGTDGERARLPAEPGRVADTTGAGDALCAGFLAAWLFGAPPDAALRRGVEVAARAVERLGARPGG